MAIAHAVSGSTEAFVKLMNEKAGELNMDNTVFNNPSGLDEEKGNFSSAYDMALLMSYAMDNEIFRMITGTKSHTVETNKNVYKWTNKNKLLSSYKYTTGGKTGYTKKAKRTLVTTASKDNLNLVVVTINDGSDWADHKGLYEEAFRKYTSYTIVDKGTTSILGETYYQNDLLYLKDEYKYPLLESEKESINLKFTLEKHRNYKSGDKVGNVDIYLADKKVGSRSIYVDKGKTELSFLDKLRNWIRK